MKTKRSVKARKMWANYYGNGTPVIHATLIRAREYGPHALNRQAVYVLPADAASYNAMVEQGAQSLRRSQHGWLIGECRYLSKQYLSALGITRPAKTRK